MKFNLYTTNYTYQNSFRHILPILGVLCHYMSFVFLYVIIFVQSKLESITAKEIFTVICFDNLVGGHAHMRASAIISPTLASRNHICPSIIISRSCLYKENSDIYSKFSNSLKKLILLNIILLVMF